MKIRYLLQIGPLCFILLSCSSPRVLKVLPPHGAEDTYVQGNYLIVSGGGEVKDRPAPSGDTVRLRLGARRAAILDAQRNSLRFLGLAQRVKVGSVEYERVEGIVKGSQIIHEEWPTPHQTRITLKIPLNGPGSLAEGLNYNEIIIK